MHPNAYSRVPTALLSLGLILATVVSARAQTGYPMLMSLQPAAAQVGQTSEHVVTSRYSLDGAYQILVSGSGVAGEIALPPPKLEDLGKPAKEITKLPIRFTVAPDAQPGVRDFRIVTPRGVSTIGQLVIAREAVVQETGKNDAAEQAQAIELPATICGTIEKAEDVDYFKFHATAGQSFAFNVRSARLQDRIHDLQQHSDPILTLRNAMGVTIAASDNYFFGDPLLCQRFEQAGDYLLEIRDVRYQGNQYWEYAIEAATGPLVETVFPLAIAPGKETSLELVGYQLPDSPLVDFVPPTSLPLGFVELPLQLAGATPTAEMIVTNLPLVTEAADDNDSLASAAAISVPCGINGRIEREGDVDYYSFEAKKGEAFSLEVVSRRRQSSLDSLVRILNERGIQVGKNDDLKLGKRTSADSWLENWIAPADGKYTIELRDVHLRGGPQFPYFLQVTRSEPYFELYIDTDKTQIGPGGCAAIFVRVERKCGFTGEVQLQIDGLPPGVTASCGRILAGKPVDGCIILHADDDAPLAAGNVVIRGTAEQSKPDSSTQQLSAIAQPYQETYQPGGGRGHWPVDTHTVAVTDYGDLRGVYLNTYDVVLKPGESQKIEITIDRSPGFKANVSLDMLYVHLNSVFANTLPPGVTLDDKQAQSLLAGDKTHGYLTLKAAKDAPPVEGQQCVVMGHVSLNFVMKTTFASQPLNVSVRQ
jgi:hypothetical protein